MSNPDSPDITSELAALKSFFQTSKQELERNNVVNMVGIDKRIATVCQNIQQASAEQQAKLLPELTILIDLLNSYEQALRDFQAVQLEAAARIASADDKS